MCIIGITGGKGMLGSDIAKLVQKENIQVNIYDLPTFDITRKGDIEKIVNECDFIINCAAYTAVDKAESEPELAEAVNALAVAELARAAKIEKKYIIHISTDFVFGDNGKTPLNENSEVNPLSVYGATKLKGEKLLQESGCKNAIIRIEWTYGNNGKNFITKIMELAADRDQLTVVGDQIGSPTSTVDVAKAVLFFIKNQTEGLYHFAADGYASRFEVAEFILKETGDKTPLFSCSSNEFSAPAQRPQNSRFDCSKIDKVLDFRRPHWQKSLSEFLQK